MDNLLLIACVGFLAQLVDGALGMAYGTVSAAVLLALGVTPANTSAAVHTAQIFTCAASGLSHIWHGNVLWPIFWRLVGPGVAGAVVGATILVHLDQAAIKPWISAYLGGLGLFILYRVARPNRIRKPAAADKAAIPLGFVAATACKEPKGPGKIIGNTGLGVIPDVRCFLALGLSAHVFRRRGPRQRAFPCRNHDQNRHHVCLHDRPGADGRAGQRRSDRPVRIRSRHCGGVRGWRSDVLSGGAPA
jgi:hypothetical protein